MKTKKSHDKLIKKTKSRIVFALAASLTLGLAPFYPEPHLFGKWKWVIGGAEGMQAMDWFDLILHSSPWALLIYFVLMLVRLSKPRR